MGLALDVFFTDLFIFILILWPLCDDLDLLFILSALKYFQLKILMTSNHSIKRRSLNQVKMSDNYFSSPIENAHLLEFDDASYHNDNPLSPINEARLLQFDQEWDEIARLIESQEALFTQEGDQQPAPLQASGEIILANPGQTTLLTGSLDLIWAIPFLEIVGQFLGHIPEHEGISKSGTQFSPSQVEDFLQTSSPVGISTLEKDDQKCSICMSEYVKERGDTNKPAMESGKGLLGVDAPENPIKLPCGPVFGE